MEEKKTWWQRHGWIAVGGAFILLAIIFNVLGVHDNPPQVSPSDTGSPSVSGSDLNATVSTKGDGLHITNNEDSAWTNCMAGVNGGSGWGFDNPPYQTRFPVGFQSGIEHTILYRDMTTTDGTFFDPNTHTVNSIVIVCNQGAATARYWTGGPVGS